MPPKSTDVPVSTFHGVLKQLSAADLSPDERAALDLCFPEFLQEELRTTPLRELGIRYDITAYQARPVSWGRLRRYAGSASFGSGRYYSVCSDSAGFDGGTLLNELMTYWSESTMVFPEVSDTTLLSSQIRSAHPELASPRLLIRVKRYRERRKLIRKRFVEETNESPWSLPLSVRDLKIEGVIDLRIPDTQAWFFEHFVRLEERIGLQGHSGEAVAVLTYKYRKVHDFIDLLPTLVVPGIGGSTFHQAVGAWLRSHGVAGLVYPSARSNAYLRLLSEESGKGHRRQIISFSGWNFVDYRGAGSSEWKSLFGRLPTWVLPMKAGIRVREHQGDQPGWEIEGAEEAERRRVRLSYDIMLGNIKTPPGWDPRGGYRRPYYESS